jgi:excisionase family DNA binding protein
MQLTIELTDSQLRQLAAEVAKLTTRPAVDRPLTVHEFAEATRLSVNTVYRRVEAGEIRRVKGLAKVLIPAAELERFR